jgi:hypothetical protein
MYIRLIRNKPQGNAITGRLVIDSRWFCNTLERVGYQIPALCYHIAVTMSPKFRRLLPIVENVPQRSGIRFHRGTKPEHSTGCILVVADNPSRAREFLSRQKAQTIAPRTIGAEVVDNNVVEVVDNKTPVGCRSAADVEQSLTQLLLQTQESHEEIILEVIDFRAGTQYGYDHPCPSSECACEKEIRSAHFARRHSSSILEATSFSDDF